MRLKRTPFLDSSSSGLFRVSFDGGEPEPLTTPDRARGEISHRWPQFLPDGRVLWKLFDGRYAVEPGGQHDYDVSPDGERFLMIAVDEPSAPNEMRVVLNWFDELSRLAPVP